MAERNGGAGERRTKAGASKTIAETIEALKEEVEGAAQEGVERLAAQAGAAAEAVERNAALFSEKLREAAQPFIAEQQQRIADMVQGLAEALHGAGATLKREGKEAAARYADQAAAQIDRFAESVRQRRLEDLLASTEDFARRQPALFLAGAVAAGFVIARALAPLAKSAPRASAQGFAGQDDAQPTGQPLDVPVVDSLPRAEMDRL
jgi:hypothetical protein